ncbi:toll/interleukin-1 receptor domain-containing protein [Candidatus Nitrotoga sp. 1052]|uniref:toll/interleukin-1 receptor domain-containing protein n=1 Tax=Candidatus Nitrotoga sp. 1052 TaxID=2886964 RepID=UPI001EF659DE|nr:toll/interleukin-1 receptor domain-containing protein [Candidatus Nitrotoga sp. 1052]
MTELRKNAIAFLQKRFPAALVLDREHTMLSLAGEITKEIKKFFPMIAHDMQSGVKQRTIAIENLGNANEIPYLMKDLEKIFLEMDNSIYMKMGNSINQRGHDIDTTQMTFAPRVILYTNKLHIPIEQLLQEFSSIDTLIDVVNESEMHKTLFISYGGPDELAVKEINKQLKSKGIKTWFFPEDAPPGGKLHRVMHEGVNEYERVLLICSEKSLIRSGVLNEIERVLEREAKEGGSDILIPITLDDFVYGDWAPTRADVAAQVRARVITKIDTGNEVDLETQLGKLINVLHK